MSIITGDPEEKSFFIKGPSGNLEVKSLGLGEKTITGIICHPHPLYQGTMDNKVVTTILRAWKELGIATIRFNFRGVGKSEGHYGEGKGEVEDLKAVIDWVQNSQNSQNNRSFKLWLGGFSFGAAIAATVAGQLSKKSQVFQEPKKSEGSQESEESKGPQVTDVSQAFQVSSESIVSALLTVAPPVNHFEFEKINIPYCPWLMIHGEKDEVVPYDNVIFFVEQLKKKKKDFQFIEIKNATHFFHGQLVELKSQIINSMKHWASS